MSSIKRIIQYYKNKLKLKLRGLEVEEVEDYPVVLVNKTLSESDKETLRKTYTDIPSVEEVKEKLIKKVVTPEGIPSLITAYIANRHEIRLAVIDDLKGTEQNVYVLRDRKNLLWDAEEDYTFLRGSYESAKPVEKSALKYTWVYFNREKLEEKGYALTFVESSLRDNSSGVIIDWS